jgi:hypothetical protein
MSYRSIQIFDGRRSPDSPSVFPSRAKASRIRQTYPRAASSHPHKKQNHRSPIYLRSMSIPDAPTKKLCKLTGKKRRCATRHHTHTYTCTHARARARTHTHTHTHIEFCGMRAHPTSLRISLTRPFPPSFRPLSSGSPPFLRCLRAYTREDPQQRRIVSLRNVAAESP